jgi:plasmid maintenance system antidote protein VapI
MNTIKHDEAIELIRGMVKKNGSQFAAAKALDISPAYLGDILAGKRSISDNIARKLGYRRVVVFVKEG